jgi:hypothetical protein
MALLTDAQRREAWAEWMRANLDTIGISKADLRAAIDAVDGWVDGNASSFNVSIPQPARNSLSAKQKALLLLYVVDKRFKVL